jgi:hypothetical protein
LSKTNAGRETGFAPQYSGGPAQIHYALCVHGRFDSFLKRTGKFSSPAGSTGSSRSIFAAHLPFHQGDSLC